MSDPELSSTTNEAGRTQPAVTGRVNSPGTPPMPSKITAVWANTGEDKVLRGETRASSGASVINSTWDGRGIKLFAAKNETTNFNLILEAKTSDAVAVSVQFSKLTGPNGVVISSPPPDASKIFEWTDRNIELFYIRYLQINGIASKPSDERVWAANMQRPQPQKPGVGVGGWTDRPGHNGYFPEIAIPMELTPEFSISAGQSQAIWADIYVPKRVPAGEYNGTLTVSEGAKVTHTVPVTLTVANFTLPDKPALKNILAFEDGLLGPRVTGVAWVGPGTPEYAKTERVESTAYMLAHRAGIDLIGDNLDKFTQIGPNALAASALTGSLYTPAKGYGGRGLETGNQVYSIFTYGGLGNAKGGFWGPATEATVKSNAAAWDEWFKKKAPSVERFIYLGDELTDAANMTRIDQQASWIRELNLPIKTFVTNFFNNAVAHEPNVDIVANTALDNFGGTALGDNRVLMPQAVATIQHKPRGEAWWYNGNPPYMGYPGEIEDDGLSPRVTQWAIWKKKLDGYFFWDSTYYVDTQTGGGKLDVFNEARTFGWSMRNTDPVFGISDPYLDNGNGVLFYPGTDTVYPKSNYHQLGVFSSIRLKFWRRGIEDYDYLVMANAVNPTATAAIVNKLVPAVLWDIQSLGGYTMTPIEWSTKPDDWESAREQLANIIQSSKPRPSAQATAIRPDRH